ncbi:MAG: enoyl-CoA hydratase/isomerase family protein [Actinobacteria bacterium]|nr:enoyl-CoA hydratase/isomerase family protein [Actinomycetota bacterium]
MPSLPDFDTIRFELDGLIGRLVLDRPDKLNSFTIAMWREMRELGELLLADPGELRALIVVGEGRAFSSGIDTSVFAEGTGGDQIADEGSEKPAHDDPVVNGILATQEAFTWLEEAPFVTIAAVRGYAFGAGLQLALACDLRVMARGTKMGLLELQYGILPDLGGTQRLTRLVGPGRAKEMIFTRAKIDADDAERFGIAEHVVPDEELEEVARTLAETIAAQPPIAVRGAKRAIAVAIEGGSVRDGLLAEAEGQADCMRSDDMKEAITAFIEQRDPVYRGT